MNCPICNKEFYVPPSTIKRGSGKYCSRKCYYVSKKGKPSHRDARKKSACIICKKIILVPKHRKDTMKYCSLSCRSAGRKKWFSLEKSSNWKGGRIIQGGYIMIKTLNHPFAPKNNYILEHRLVMEKHLGRYLLPTEIVHHIDGDKLNNSIDNLMLFPSKSAHTKFHSMQNC